MQRKLDGKKNCAKLSDQFFIVRYAGASWKRFARMPRPVAIDVELLFIGRAIAAGKG